ncbi:MAG: histidine kinase, partial [Chitinophagales bacterium]|nr:histidine kinase [Chitinophagales bacterium]
MSFYANLEDEMLVEEFRRTIVEDPLASAVLFKELQKRNINAWPAELKFNYYKNAANYHINRHLYELAHHYVGMARSVAEISGNEEWAFQIEITRAVLLTAKSDLKQSIDLFESLLHRLPPVNTDKYKANIYMRLGVAHGKSGNLKESLQYNLLALPYFDETENQMRFSIRANLITAYMQLGMQKELERMFEDFNREIHLCKFKSILVFFHSNYGVFLNEQKKYQEALAHAETALKLCIGTAQWSPLSIALRVKSGALFHLGRPLLSYLYSLRNIQVLQNTTDYYSISLAHLNLASFLKLHGKPIKARHHAENAREISRQYGVKYILKMALEFLAGWEEEENNYEQATRYLRELLSVKEDLLNHEKANAVAEAMAKYEVAEKEKEAQRLRSEVAEYNLKLLRSQMNPHFIFNSINSINNFILKNDSHTASYYLIRFSQLMRKILDYTTLQEISLEKEIEFLKDYLELEKLRFSCPFHYEISVDRNIDTNDIKIPPMLFQPYVENSIWHGIRHRDSKGFIQILISLRKGDLHVSISDNGVG